ncbi:MAG: DUF1761 domain-containing protein [Woeseiaceae bacterium]|nr:DUF1761 domain-containing protein [Woeseiaceae bacterium]
MDINIWAVLVAAVSSFLLGGLWYSPMLFLNPWNKAMNRSDGEKGPHPAQTFGIAFAFALLSAFLFAKLLGPAPQMLYAVHMGFFVGLGFVAASFGINYQFANRPFSALFIDGGYHTAQFVLFGVVLGFWH